MKLIKLHTRSDGDAVYINPEHIVSIWKNTQGVFMQKKRETE